MQRLDLKYMVDYESYSDRYDEPDRWRLRTPTYPSSARSNPEAPLHNTAWSELATFVKDAYNTVLCECNNSLAIHGLRCFECVLKEGLAAQPPAPPPPKSIAEMAAAEGGEGWADVAENASLCCVCRERRNKQLRLEPCGHIYCMICCSGIQKLECPICSQKAVKAQKVFFA